jgi:hypothetical protein
MEFIDPKNVRPGKIKHDGLGLDWEEIARHTYNVVGHLVKPTYEQWELDFLRDQNPQQELFLWLLISDSFEAATAERQDLDERTILGDLILISAGGQSQYDLGEIYLKATKKYQRGNDTG